MEDIFTKKENFSEETDFTAMKVKRLSEMAFLPTRGSALAAGYDLYR